MKKLLRFFYYQIFDMLSDVTVAHISFFISHRRQLNLKGDTFSDRITFRRLYPLCADFCILTDKYEVRNYVTQRIGSEYLIPLLAITDDAEKINFAALPNQFVMKSNHATQRIELVFDKSKIEVEGLRKIASDWLKYDFYKATREQHYKDIQRKILFEELLLDENGKVPTDYKFHCFRKNGVLNQFIQVNSNRFANHTLDFFDLQWNRLNIKLHYPTSSVPPARPTLLNKMSEIAAILSEQFNYIRVDLYCVKNQIFFGELTFTPGCGLKKMYPQQVDREWGMLFEPDEFFYGEMKCK